MVHLVITPTFWFGNPVGTVCTGGISGYEASGVCCALACGTCGGTGCASIEGTSECPDYTLQSVLQMLLDI